CIRVGLVTLSCSSIVFNDHWRYRQVIDTQCQMIAVQSIAFCFEVLDEAAVILVVKKQFDACCTSIKQDNGSFLPVKHALLCGNNASFQLCLSTLPLWIECAKETSLLCASLTMTIMGCRQGYAPFFLPIASA